MYGNEIRGLSEFFDGVMAGVKTRPITCIKVIEATAFTTLTLENKPTTNSTDATNNPTGVTFPAGYEIWNVAAFRITTGSVQVFYKGTSS